MATRALTFFVVSSIEHDAWEEAFWHSVWCACSAEHFVDFFFVSSKKTDKKIYALA